MLQRNIPILELWNIFNWEPLAMWSESSIQHLGWPSILNGRGKASLFVWQQKSPREEDRSQILVNSISPVVDQQILKPTTAQYLFLLAAPASPQMPGKSFLQ